MPVNRILILPGMDGTGDLLLDFLHALPSQMHKKIAIYPKDRVLSQDDLAKLVRSICEDFEPEVILAESFSTALAIRIAAERPKNLKGLVLCVGFAASPLRGLTRWLSWCFSPTFRNAKQYARTIRPEHRRGGSRQVLYQGTTSAAIENT